jgi:hypothetical protein
MVSIPSDSTITIIARVMRDSWLAGRTVESIYALPLGALIRPGLLLIMFYSLAVDTIIDLHRATKAGPPNLGLAEQGRPAFAPAAAA